jgi:RNA polymerase subunit RPABC4/transcription elongation factor Spt4
MARTCENCGTRLQGGRCPNCHEETFIRDQYIEQGMPLPPEDSDFMKKVIEQEKDIFRQYDLAWAKRQEEILNQRIKNE